jgi:hypothetical protein
MIGEATGRVPLDRRGLLEGFGHNDPSPFRVLFVGGGFLRDHMTFSWKHDAGRFWYLGYVNDLQQAF